MTKSNTFYRLIKKDKDNIGGRGFQIYDFHTSTNGFMWYQYHEADLNEDGTKSGGFHDKAVKLGYGEEAIAKGNAFYLKKKTEGFKFYGVYEQDVCGYETLKQKARFIGVGSSLGSEMI